MILAAHQPCYLPSIFFFQKLAAADIFILADDYQYTTNNQINRTKIKTKVGWSWLTLPALTSGYSGQLIKNVKLNNNYSWQDKHIRTLHGNYAYAAYFEQYIDRIENILHGREKCLIQLTLDLISFIINELNLCTEIVVCSELNLPDQSNNKLLAMLEKTNCGTYLADSKLSGFLDKEEFETNGFSLKFVKPGIKKYHQLFGDFIPNLSIIDLMFNEGYESGSFMALESKDGK